MQVLILFSPFAILSLIDNSTNWIFKSWARAIFSLLLIQVFVPLIIIVIFSSDKNKLLYVGGVYGLTRINSYINQLFGGINIDISSAGDSISRTIKK